MPNADQNYTLQNQAVGSALRAAQGDAIGPAETKAHPTLQLMQMRHTEGSKPGSRSDAFKLGLVVEVTRGLVCNESVSADSGTMDTVRGDIAWRLFGGRCLTKKLGVEPFQCLHALSHGVVR